MSDSDRPPHDPGRLDPAADPAAVHAGALEPSLLDPTQLDPVQLDLAPVGLGLTTVPAAEPVPAMAGATAAPSTGGEASAVPSGGKRQPVRSELTMELAPADRPDADTVRRCPLCATAAALTDVYCEVCGVQLTNDREHYSEQPDRWLAAVTDRGRRRVHNEDASAVSMPAPDCGVLVVCDGVSSAEESDLASLVAARAARDTLRGVAEVTGAEDLAAQLTAAVVAAHEAALRQTTPGSGASCTIASAVVRDDLIAVAAIGDSRIYWLPDPSAGRGDPVLPPPDQSAADQSAPPDGVDWTAPMLLSVDDSVAELRVAAGADRAQAEQAPDAHVITGWIGQHASAPDPRPLLVRPSVPGWLLLCSDGLWNYVSEPRELTALVGELAAELRPGALALADALVRWAVEQGGKDNTTVALARVPLGVEH